MTTDDSRRKGAKERGVASRVAHTVATGVTSVAQRAKEAATSVAHGVQGAARSVASAGAREGMTSAARAVRELPSEHEAARVFDERVERLLDVNGWSVLSGVENANFELFDENGERSVRPRASVGDFVRIDLPGPIPHEWVRIEAIERDRAHARVTLRPSHDPTRRPERPEVTEHFFTRESTNNVLLEREGATVVARVIGLDERPNVEDEVDGATKAVVNRVVAETGWGVKHEEPGVGPVGGLQQHQWDRFVANLVGA